MNGVVTHLTYLCPTKTKKTLTKTTTVTVTVTPTVTLKVSDKTEPNGPTSSVTRNPSVIAPAPEGSPEPTTTITRCITSTITKTLTVSRAKTLTTKSSGSPGEAVTKSTTHKIAASSSVSRPASALPRFVPT